MAENRAIRWNARIKDSAYPIVTTLAILVLWQLSIVLFSVPDFILPGPLVIIKAFFGHLGLLSGRHLDSTAADPQVP